MATERTASTATAGFDRLHGTLEGQPSRYADRKGDGAPEMPPLLDRRAKTGSKTGNRTGKTEAVAD
jgi:hypothetical protein